MNLYAEFDKKLSLNKHFGIDLNNPKFLKQSFAIKAIISMQEIADKFVSKIAKDKRFSQTLSSDKQEIIKKKITRFSIYIMVFSYSQLLKHINELLHIFKRLNIPLDILLEYYLYFSARFEEWAICNFELNSSEQFFYKRKVDSILFLIAKHNDDQFLSYLENLLDSIPTSTPTNIQMAEIELFAFLEDSIDQGSKDDLKKLLNKYLSVLQLSPQKGSDKIASLLAKTILIIDQYSSFLYQNKNANILVADLLEKFAFYTSDSEFQQATLALHYLDMQIELTLFRVFAQVKS